MTQTGNTPNVSAPVREKVRELLDMGLPPRQVALALGISVQRVYQHIAKLRERGELPTREAR